MSVAALVEDTAGLISERHAVVNTHGQLTIDH